MRIAVTGHTSGLGKAIHERWPDQTIGFSRSNGYNIDDYVSRQRIIQESMQCEIFINCAHSGTSQVYLLYELCKAWQRTDRLIINIGSNSSDGIKPYAHVYAVEKTALDKACEQLSALHDSCRIVNLRPGYIDVPRLQHLTDQPKLSNDAMIDIIDYLMQQPANSNIPSITILPRASHQQWYFSDLIFPFFTDERCAAIRKIASTVIDQCSHEGYEYSAFDHLRFYDVTKEMPELKALTDDCVVGARADLFFLPPNITMPIHSDTKDYNTIRASAIAIGILPEYDIPSTHWYWSTTAPPCATAHWTANDVKLLNIRSLHGGIKTDHRWRVNLQLSIDIGYDEVLDLVRNGKLFRTNDVRLRDV